MAIHPDSITDFKSPTPSSVGPDVVSVAVGTGTPRQFSVAYHDRSGDEKVLDMEIKHVGDHSANVYIGGKKIAFIDLFGDASPVQQLKSLSDNVFQHAAVGRISLRGAILARDTLQLAIDGLAKYPSTPNETVVVPDPTPMSRPFVEIAPAATLAALTVWRN